MVDWDFQSLSATHFLLLNNLLLLQVTTSIYNLILGKLYCDHYGTMRIQGNRNYSCKLKFKEQSIIDRNPHQVLSLTLSLSLSLSLALTQTQSRFMVFYHYVELLCKLLGWCVRSADHIFIIIVLLIMK